MQLICARCGGTSFRFVKKSKSSYCLKCGWEISESEITGIAGAEQTK